LTEAAMGSWERKLGLIVPSWNTGAGRLFREA
jgi:hypothetical protein